jgi:hypothetical protein
MRTEVDRLLEDSLSGPHRAREVAQEEVGEERRLSHPGLADGHDGDALSVLVQAAQPLLLQTSLQIC